MNRRDGIRMEDLSNDGGPYLPVCLCLDTSESMLRREGSFSRETNEPQGPTRLELLRQGVEEFYKAVYSNEVARCTVELAVVTFGDTANLVKPFSRLEHMRRGPGGSLVSGGMEWVPQLKCAGRQTVMGEGVNLALDLLEQCKVDYRNMGMDYYQPWLVLISDGWNTGDKAQFQRAQSRIAKLVGARKLAVYPLAIGAHANLKELDALSPDQKAFGLKAVQMSSLFKWLAKSAEKVSSGELGLYRSPKLENYEVVSWTLELGKR